MAKGANAVEPSGKASLQVFTAESAASVSCSVLSGPQPGLVPTDAGHVAGEQRCRRGAERDQEPAGEAGVHHEAGVQPVRPADRAEGAGGSAPGGDATESERASLTDCLFVVC